MKAPVALDQARTFDARDLSDRLVDCIGWHVQVDSCKGTAKPVVQHYVGVAGSLRSRAFASDVRSKGVVVSQLPVEFDQARLNLCFVEE